jgi:nitrogenase-stabilizing/protective protein
MGEATMTGTLADLRKLTDAEEYLTFFGIPYDETFVNVNRLHILKQFALLLKEVDEAFPDITETEKLEKYKEALTEAYEVFFSKSPLETKLFKVFQDRPKNIVLLSEITMKPGVL